jgi:hypothetical protein
MISPQVSANRAQAASDKRAIADHETLIALHEMAKQQLTILQNNFARKDMPGKQEEILAAAHKILAAGQRYISGRMSQRLGDPAVG